jgi:SET domain-containing protein
MPDSSKYYEIRRSPIAGRGAFAIRRIRKGTRIAEYTGEVISDAESDERYPDDDGAPHHTFLFDIGWGKNVDATVNGGDAKYINHSCDPNCEAVVEKRRIYIDAIRTIHPGEEIFYDYQYARDGESDEEARRKYPCQCGAENCRGTIMVAAKKKRKKAATKRVKKGTKKEPKTRR